MPAMQVCSTDRPLRGSIRECVVAELLVPVQYVMCAVNIMIYITNFHEIIENIYYKNRSKSIGQGNMLGLMIFETFFSLIENVI